jgi:SAM-dependent methyltransferase
MPKVIDPPTSVRGSPTRRSRTLRGFSKLIGVSRELHDQIEQRARRMLRPVWLGRAYAAPFSDRCGGDRGTPIDRIFIEHFLEGHRGLIRGRVLEVQNSLYTDRFGTDVEASDILDIDPTNRRATIIADLAVPESLPDRRFDCFVLTQTLQYIFDVRAAVIAAHRVLRPGGVVLATVPAVSRMDPKTPHLDCWRFTTVSCTKLFESVFGAGNVRVRGYGNALASAAYLMGLAAEDLRRKHIDAYDERFPLIIAVRAIRDQTDR